MVALAGCELANKYPWNTKIAYAICMAESGGNAHADNIGLNSDGSNDKGLYQINSIHVASGLITDQDRFDPVKNVDAAYTIYKGSGWRAWSTFSNGRYLRWYN